MNEADIRAKIVTRWLAGHGFHESEFTLEYVFSVKIGRVTFNVDGRPQARKKGVANPRADVLVKRNGRNLFVIEVKAPGQLVDDARDQGISYARLLDEIAPFVVVTDGTETRIYDSITKCEVTGETIPTDHPHALSGFRISANDIALRAEALDLFMSLSPENLIEFCRLQVATRMHRLRGDCIESGKKYIPALYVARNRASDRLRELLNEKKARVIVLTGAPQIGKTNFLCNFVQEEIDNGRPCLFFPSISMLSGLLDEIAEDFGWVGFSSPETSPQLAKRLSRVLKASGKDLTIVLDGWNEADVNAAVAIDQELERISNYTTNIATVLSFTNTSAQRLLMNRGNPTFVAEAARIKPSDISLIETNSNQLFEKSDWNAIFLENYSQDELNVAYKKYADAFDVKYDKHPTSDPYLLAVAMRHYHGQSLPDELDERSLIENWLKARILRAFNNVTDVQAALSEMGCEILQSGAPLESVKLKRSWAIPVTSNIDSGYFDGALLARYPGTNCELVDFYFSRDRDFVLSIWAAKWDQKIEELLFSEAIFPSLMKSGQACIDAAIWFFSQREIQQSLVNNGRLPSFACPGLNRLYVRGFTVSLSRSKEKPLLHRGAVDSAPVVRPSISVRDGNSATGFLGYAIDHWFEQFVELTETAKDLELQVEALRCALQLAEFVDLDYLPTAFLEKFTDFDRIVRSILEIDYHSAGAHLSKGIGVEFLSALHAHIRDEGVGPISSEDETYVSESVYRVMKDSRSYEEHILASLSYANMCPREFIRELKGVPAKIQKDDYLTCIANAVSVLEGDYYGTGICPSYLDSLEGDTERSESEFDTVRDLLNCIAESNWTEAPVIHLRELLANIGSHLPSPPDISPNECPGQMKFGFTSED